MNTPEQKEFNTIMQKRREVSDGAHVGTAGQGGQGGDLPPPQNNDSKGGSEEDEDESKTGSRGTLPPNTPKGVSASTDSSDHSVVVPGGMKRKTRVPGTSSSSDNDLFDDTAGNSVIWDKADSKRNSTGPLRLDYDSDKTVDLHLDDWSDDDNE